jgi:hypothetical protein
MLAVLECSVKRAYVLIDLIASGCREFNCGLKGYIYLDAPCTVKEGGLIWR